MVDSSNKKRKEFISEGDIAALLQRYDTMTILKLLQEMAFYAKPKMDWDELVKKTNTGITNAGEYQLLWRHLAYRDSLLPVEDEAPILDDDSDMECELEASPAVSVDAVADAIAHVKVIAASYVPSESDIPEDSTVEAPLTINIPYGLQSRPQEPSDSYWSPRGMNITFPVLLQKATEGHNGNGLSSSIAPRKRRKKWSAEEDEELIAAVKRQGEGSWALIAKEEFEGERTASQLSQRWGAIRRRCDTSNSSTQSGLQRTEAQMAANRALSLAVGNRLPSKKLAAGIPPMLSSGITGPQANGPNSGSSLQGYQQSQPVVQALPRATTSAPTAKSRVTGKKTTANSISRAELMSTANSVAAAALMSCVATAAPVPNVELGKNTVAALGPKAEPIKTASAASLARPSGILPALNAESGKISSAASLPRPSGILPALNTETVKTASTASLLRPSGIAASLPRPSGIAASLPRPSGIAASAPRPSGVIPKAQPVKTASASPLLRPSGIAASLPRPSGIVASLPRPSGIAAALPRPSGVISTPKAEPVKTASVAFLPRPSSILSAPKVEPVKNLVAAATNTQAVGPLNARHAVNGSPSHVISSSSSNKPSPMSSLSKGSTIQNHSVPSGFASSRLAPVQGVPATTQKPSATAAVTASCKPAGVQKEKDQGNRASPLVTTLQPDKTSTNSAISTGKLVAAKVETPPSLMPKKNQVVQSEVSSCTAKSSLDKQPEKETSATVSPLIGAEAETKPKVDASKGKKDVASVTGIVQKEL